MPLLKNKEYSKSAKFTPELLIKFCQENGIDCSFSNNTEDIKKDRNSRINGKCINENCNNNFEIDFRRLIEKKIFYCRGCLIPISKVKRVETCNKIYGVSHITQLKKTQDKIKETCEKKYGGKSHMHSQEIKAKIKKTNDNKSHQEKEEIRIKRINTNKQTRGIEYLDFSKEALCKLCDEHSIKLLDNEGNDTNGDFYENVTRNDLIYYKCIHPECEIKSNKTYRRIKEGSGAFCKDHTTKQMVNKCKKTYMKNTGYDHPMHNPVHYNKVVDKIKETHDDPIKSSKIRKQTKQTNLLNNGVEYPMQNKEVQNKCKRTCMQKYGAEHPAQNEEIMQKCSNNAYKKKDYIFPSGKIIEIQGYENYGLDELLQDGTLEEEIKTGNRNVPEIWYEDDKHIKHRHYVDIFIPKQNRCIEIKSTWTATKKKDCIFLKQEAGRQLGYTYEIWVYNEKGKKVEFY